MSTLKGATHGGLRFVTLTGSSGRLAACFMIVLAVLFTSSCSLTGQNANTPGNTPQNLVLSGNLPAGTANQAYNAVLTVGGGSSPYQFSLKSGSLPPGMALNAATGSISGTPTTAGSYNFEIQVADAPQPDQGSQRFSIPISSPGSGVRVTVAPSSANVISGQNQAFTATVSGTNNTGVTWSASAGTITQNGLYTAPVVNAVANAVITATSNAAPSQQGTATVVVEPPVNSPVTITNSNPPDGQVGTPYTFTFTATGGTQPYAWTAGGNLPAGVSLSNAGQFAGTPSANGSYAFTVTVTDAKAQTAQASYSVTISAAAGNFDGPAELPRATVDTVLADTPAPGSVIVVNSGGDLQTALNNANCGDIVELQTGATFTGNFNLPAKSCDDAHWIIVRTSASDSALPAEGQRMNPCYAGVASLPARPAFSCPNSQNVLSKIVWSGGGDGPLILQAGANHYRFIGLEVTRVAATKGAPTFLTVAVGGTADHIIVDRSWFHGTPHDEAQNGVATKGMNYAAVVDSYFNDFHCISGTGTCTDAHAISGGLGSHQDGTFKFSGNFLEASGEAILFGGGGGTTSPTDISIQRNHFFKPWIWMPGNPNFVGGPTGNPFIVKNHLELKNAVRVLVEANVMENNWGGFSQNGYAILLSPKNQHSPNGNLCPLCQVTDVTVRYNHISHAGGGMVFATSISGNGVGGGYALAGTRWSVHDLVIDDISQAYTGGGTLFLVENGWPANPLNTLTINHVTGFPDPGSHVLLLGNNAPNPPMYGFVFINNLTTTGRYPVWNRGGGSASCAYSSVPVTAISNCFTTYTFSTNALLDSPKAFPPSTWPSGNLFGTSGNAGFQRYNEGNGGNYQLQSGSPYKNAGTDGKDLGADILGLNAALNGVE